jgi:hypothetical protein
MPARTSPQSSSSFEINNKGISGVDKSKGSGRSGLFEPVQVVSDGNEWPSCSTGNGTWSA